MFSLDKCVLSDEDWKSGTMMVETPPFFCNCLFATIIAKLFDWKNVQIRKQYGDGIPHFVWINHKYKYIGEFLPNPRYPTPITNFLLDHDICPPLFLGSLFYRPLCTPDVTEEEAINTEIVFLQTD